jgi:cytochrome c peroxidase
LVRAADYYADLKALYKENEVDSDEDLFARITELISIYQRDDADYNLFDSRFDKSLLSPQVLTSSERRGLAIFNDSNRGNCMTCHSASGAKPLFTNFGYTAIGAPRNHEGPKNVDPAYFDLGLCMRERAKSEEKKRGASNDRYCGMFKTPTLRNIAQTAPYFHNGSVSTLEAAVRFHFERDTQPSKWYKRADGSVDSAYNDLPAKYQVNLSRGKPFSGSYSPTDAEVADLVAFLKTLTDADQIDATN